MRSLWLRFDFDGRSTAYQRSLRSHWRNPLAAVALSYLCPVPNRRGIKRWYASDVCLSVAYIGPKSRTERHRKTKIGTEVTHVTRDSDTTFKVKRSNVEVTRPLYSPPCWRVRQLRRWAWERVGHGKLLLRCRLLGSARRFGAHGEEGRGHTVVAACLQLAYLCRNIAATTGKPTVVARSPMFCHKSWPKHVLPVCCCIFSACLPYLVNKDGYYIYRFRVTTVALIASFKLVTFNMLSVLKVWYGIVEFNVPLDTVYRRQGHK